MTQSASSYNLSSTTTRSPAECLPVLFLRMIILSAQQLSQGLLNIACLQYLATNRKKKPVHKWLPALAESKGALSNTRAHKADSPSGRVSFSAPMKQFSSTVSENTAALNPKKPAKACELHCRNPF